MKPKIKNANLIHASAGRQNVFEKMRVLNRRSKNHDCAYFGRH